MSYDPVEPFIEHRWEPRLFWLRKPRKVGTRFLIVRSDQVLPGDDPGGGRIPIRLDLHRSFGSGGHGTTEGCLVALEQAVHGGERVLDLGTGTGILAIAAGKLGAAQVTAVDIREQACRETRGNLLRNGMRETVQVLHGGIDAVSGRFDLVVANLRTPVLVAFMDRILERLCDHGLLVVSGIREAELHPFESFLNRFLLAPVRRIGVRGWMTLVSRRMGTGQEETANRLSGSGSPG